MRRWGKWRWEVFPGCLIELKRRFRASRICLNPWTNPCQENGCMNMRSRDKLLMLTKDRFTMKLIKNETLSTSNPLKTLISSFWENFKLTVNAFFSQWRSKYRKSKILWKELPKESIPIPKSLNTMQRVFLKNLKEAYLAMLFAWLECVWLTSIQDKSGISFLAWLALGKGLEFSLSHATMSAFSKIKSIK